MEINNKIYAKHCVKRVRIWSYSGPHFSAFGLNTERYSVFSPNAGKCRKYADQNNSEYGLFLRSENEVNSSTLDATDGIGNIIK